MMIDRIEYARANIGETKGKFAKSLNLTSQMYSNILKGRRSIEADVLGAMFNRHNINPIWILTGRGPIKIENTSVETKNKEKNESWRFEVVMHEHSKFTKAVNNAEEFNIDLDQITSNIIVDKIFSKLDLTRVVWGNRPLFLFKKILLQVTFNSQIDSDAKRFLINYIHQFKRRTLKLDTMKGILLFEIAKLTPSECEFVLCNKDLIIERMKASINKLDWITEERFGHKLY